MTKQLNAMLHVGSRREDWETPPDLFAPPLRAPPQLECLNRSGTTPARDWVNWPETVAALTERLRGVVIEQKAATDLIPQHDTPRTLFYVDPPYPFSTRSLPQDAAQPFRYRHEMTDEDHRLLAQVLHGVKGMVILSGYPCPLYDEELYPDWLRIERPAHADGAADRTEVLWLNAAASRNRQTQLEIA